MKTTIQHNLENVRRRIVAACERVGRNPSEIVLVAVTKTVEPERVNAAIAAGVTDIGENRVQEALQKFPLLKPATRHLIGHLQSNKVKKAVPIFDWIHSVDSFHLARKISTEAQRLGKTLPILLEIKTSPEETKFGVPVGEAAALAQQVGVLPGIQLRGLMTIAPFTSDEGLIRESFRTLRALRDDIRAAQFPGVQMDVLSMGMSNDFEIAIEEGATMVRIGTAIFGPRTTN